MPQLRLSIAMKPLSPVRQPSRSQIGYRNCKSPPLEFRTGGRPLLTAGGRFPPALRAERVTFGALGSSKPQGRRRLCRSLLLGSGQSGVAGHPHRFCLAMLNLPKERVATQPSTCSGGCGETTALSIDTAADVEPKERKPLLGRAELSPFRLHPPRLEPRPDCTHGV